MKIFIHIPDCTAPSFYRATLPVLHLYHELSKNGISLIGDHRPLNGETFDAYIIHRVIRADFWNFIYNLLENDKKIIWQTDDDLWNIPDWNPASKRVFESDRVIIGELIARAYKIIVSTEHLKNLICHNNKTFVLPNLIDLSFFPKNQTEERPFITILWAGSPTHDKDLQEIIQPVQRILSEFSNVRFVFWGYAPIELANFYRPPGDRHAYLIPNHHNITFLDWAEGRVYYEILSKMAPDIALGPLFNCQFNYSKSSIKSLEMIMAGAAFIGTDLPPYQWIENGKTGILVKPNNKEEWYNVMRELILHKELRRELVYQGQEIIRNCYSWQSNGKNDWLNFFNSL